jgi:hypothetical protein
MDRKALISVARSRLDDITKPYLWSDDEIALYLVEAEREAAERALLIEDDTSPLIVEISVKAGVASYRLNSMVLRVERVKLDLQPNILTRVNRETLDARARNWQAETGDPARFIDDVDTLVLYPIPTRADVARLTVKRLPVKADPANWSPEIHERHQLRLIDWVLHRAYMKPDADTFNAKRSDAAEVAFAQSFGIRPDANVQRKQREKRPITIKYGGL